MSGNPASIGKSKPSWKYVVRNFTTAWFSVVMGTGIVSNLFTNFPYDRSAVPFKTFAAIFFFLNLTIFILFTAISIARYLMFPSIWSIMIHHPVHSLYVATFPMGAATLINVCVNLLHTQYGFGGKGFLYTIWGFWWLDVAISCICCWGMIHIMTTSQEHSFETMGSTLALPFVPLTVISSSGGTLATALQPYSPGDALLTATFTVFLTSIGLSLTLMAMSIYLVRLIFYGQPKGGAVLSTILPVAAFSQAGVSILYIGQNFQALLPVAGKSASPFLGNGEVGEVIYAVCVGLSFVLWSLTTLWLVCSLLWVQAEVRTTRIPFRLPFWSTIFPMGVYATQTINLYRTLDVGFFRVYGAFLAALTLVLWVYVAVNTVTQLRTGILLESPCPEIVDIIQPRFFWKRDVDSEAGKDESREVEKRPHSRGDDSVTMIP
ncbi:hypothetical protein DENSPDRAFT_799821 [Dentipellis sp. KUC8613]|nr:hypothetical protein DENSPDRAFT_799821 [Dentipellis sp. KUC8613]